MLCDQHARLTALHRRYFYGAGGTGGRSAARAFVRFAAREPAYEAARAGNRTPLHQKDVSS